MLTNSNFYIGDSSVSRLYQGDNLIWDSSHPDILLEYISNGDASTNPDVYFNTFMAPDLTLKVETKYSYHDRSVAGGAALFGSRSSSSNSRYYLFTYAGLTVGGQPFYTAKFWYKNAEGYSALVPTLDEPHTITTYGTYSSASAATYVNCVLDGSVTSKSITITSGMSDTYQMYMFAVNNEGTVDYKAYADTRIYYMKIWRDNRLARFYVPVLHWLNGQYVPCFYDKVFDNYIYNLGTDPVKYKIHGDYLLDYLGAPPEQSIPNSTSYVMRYDSGVVASTNLQTDTKFRLVYGRENFIYGSGTSNQTTPAWQQYSLLCPGSLYRLSANFGSRAEGGLGGTLLQETSEVCDVHTCSAYFDQEMGKMYLDSTLKWQAAFVTSYLSSNTIHLFSRHGDTSDINAGAGSRIYYINFTTSNVPTKTFIPVLHNNQASFLDLNSGTYIYNLGTATPYYQFK